jgi:putative tricarboxylic transport membrane protein
MIAERVGNLFWLAVGLITLYGSFYLGLGTLREPGSGFLPFLAACFVCFMTVIATLQSFIKRKEARAKLSSLWEGTDWKRALIITFLTLGFSLALEWLGFMLSGFLLMVIIFKWEEKISWAKTLIISVVTLSCTYLLFDYFLKSTLPKGFLGF